MELMFYDKKKGCFTMIPKTCDRCGQVFFLQEKIADDASNGISIIQRYQNFKGYMIHDEYTLCPSCVGDLKKWVEDSSHTYMKEFIKRFPEYQGRESEVVGSACRDNVFRLSECTNWEPGCDLGYDECKACWNQPYKEDKTK